VVIRRNDLGRAIGPCRACVQRAFRPLWANSTSSVGGCAFTPRAHASILLGSRPASFKSCGPTRQSQQEPVFRSIGQRWLFARMTWGEQLAHAGFACKELSGHCGPTLPPRQGAVHSRRGPMQAFCSAAAPLASNNAGPRDSLGGSLFFT
jgi:hypothetical protein